MHLCGGETDQSRQFRHGHFNEHGACRFDLKDFRQTKELPAVELSQARGRCIVRVWEQGERVTVAFQQCEKMCSGNSYSYLWPILNDRRKGSCA